MLPVRAGMVLAAFALVTHAHAARQIALRVEPPQPVAALTLRNGEAVISLPVRDGRIDVPQDLPLPWTIGLTRFEATVYTRADLDAGRPLLLRELATLAGAVQARPSPAGPYTWLSVSAAPAAKPVESELTASHAGAFRLRFPAGRYHGALFGRDCATRIRSGVVLAPGTTTDLGTLVCEPTVAVAVRVVDGRSNEPVAGAHVIWDPPTAINATVARLLYAHRWSGKSDRRGAVTIRSIGPVPLPVRWRVEAEGYADERTAVTQIAAAKSLSVADVRLQPTPQVVAHVRLPESKDFAGATLYLGEPQDARVRRFRAVGRAALRDGEIRFTLRRHGPKRLWVESADGRKLLYHDVEVRDAVTQVRIEPLYAAIRGTIRAGDERVRGAIVRVADPTDAGMVLAKVASNEDGEYRLSTYQSGTVHLYAIGAGGPGRVSGAQSAKLDVDSGGDYRLDFRFDTAGVTLEVVDAESGAPVDARVQTEIVSGDKRMGGGEQPTDSEGRLVISGFRDATATLHITAAGYASETVEIPLRDGAPVHAVRMRAATPVTGRVVDIRGTPVPDAHLMGGFASELEINARHFGETDHAGRFRFDSPPAPGTPFYVLAPGHALTIATLHPNRENAIVLHPPGTGVVTLLQEHAPPPKLYMVMAAPAGGARIPLGVLNELAELNGMTAFQLHGTNRDGTLVLPEFLAPGSWELFIALRGRPVPAYHAVGAIRTPLPRSIAMSYSAPR